MGSIGTRLTWPCIDLTNFHGDYLLFLQTKPYGLINLRILQVGDKLKENRTYED